MTTDIKDEFIEHRNHTRADRVHHAIEQAGYLDGNTLAMTIGDVVSDLMHLAQREGLDWESIQAQATMHFDAEQTEP
jgi:hypothetical protein